MKTQRIREILDILDATIPEKSMLAFRFDSGGAACQVTDQDFFRIFAGKDATRRIGSSGIAFYSHYVVPDFEVHCCRDEYQRCEIESATLPAIEGGGT